MTNSAPSPLTELSACNTQDRRVFAKHEYLGPTGSIKDRMVERALICAIDAGELKAGMEIVEASSGNTGAALAAAGAKLGFPVHIFLAANISKEKIEAIRTLGGDVHLVENADQKSEIECASEFAASRHAYLFNQFRNPYHVPGYKATVAAEIAFQLDELSVRIDHFVCGVGSGGSIRAVGELLREQHNPDLKIWGVVPAIYPSDIEGLNPGHLRKQGHFDIWREREPNFETAVIEVQDEDAFRQIVYLKESSGILVGPASGACVHVARQLPEPGNILILLTDSGAKYSSKLLLWRQRLSL